MLLDDFTERVDTDISNNAGMLGLPGPPQSFGLYRDGNRLAALPEGRGRGRLRRGDAGRAALHAAPAGAGAAGRRLRRVPHRRGAARSGPPRCWRWSRNRCCSARCAHGFGPSPRGRGDRRRAAGRAPARSPPPGAAGRGTSSTFRPTSSTRRRPTRSAFAAEAIAGYLRALAPGGIVSIPVSIREFPAYAVRMLATVRAGAAGSPGSPTRRPMCWSTAPPGTSASCSPATPFGAAADRRREAVLRRPLVRRVLLSRASTSPRRGRISTTTCRRSPSRRARSPRATGPHDAIADEALRRAAGEATDVSGAAFNLSPITYDRPSFYAVLRLDRLGTILKRIEMLPQAELGPLVNLAVLAQAAVVALLVLAVPLLGGRRFRAERRRALVRRGGLFRRARARLPVHRDLC